MVMMAIYYRYLTKTILFTFNLIRHPGDLPNPGMEARSPALQVDSLPAEPPGKPEEA